jgi:M6 family metalloprotease-like protein
MKKIAFHFLTTVFLSVFTATLLAVPATPYPIERILPDGSKLTIYLRGDEFFNYTLSEDGYLIRENEQGFFTYVDTNAQGLRASTGVRVRPISERTPEEVKLTTSLQVYPDLQPQYKAQRAAKEADTDNKPMKTYPTVGSPKSLVILVNYSDVTFVTPNPNQAFTNLLNQEGYSANGGTGSARDYFKVASNGVSSPEFVVVGPYALPNNRAYYGGNTSGGDDQRSRDMIVDACKAAAAAGVDFSVYDTDNDGVVDNVFVYYAGHNEAEGGPKESVWPHRWQLNTTLTLNGKQILGYACTSELRSSSGSNMCGIGTFAHEFGHVYGLVDYYATNNATHHTLSYWNIMDAGAYLNQGRTPPTYSAYDRFYVGWLTPTILKSSQDVVLNDIKSGNSAYIITSTNNHNLNGANPNPTEFIMLEYRSRTGWDAFLPNSGMLATRIVYNKNDWWSNSPNNNANLMGVDLIEADGVASSSTLPGDPFPGSTNVTSFFPKLRSGMDMAKPITYIKEENNSVSFRFMGGGNPPTINTNQDVLQLYTTVLGNTPPEQEFKVSGVYLTDTLTITFSQGVHFELRLKNNPTDEWTNKLQLLPVQGKIDTTTILVRYNPAEPSYTEIHYEFLIARSEGADTRQTTLSGKSSRPVYVTPPIANTSSFTTLEGFEASWNPVFDASGYYLTVFSTSQGKSILTEGFDNGLSLPVDWSGSSLSLISSASFAGSAPPALELKVNGDFLETETYPIAVDTFFFYIRSIGEIDGRLLVEASDGVNWNSLDNLSIGSSLRNRVTYPVNNPALRKFRLRFTKGTSSVAIDDVGVSFNQNLQYLYFNHWHTDTTFTVKDLIPIQRYFYKVKASDRTLYPTNEVKYENITAFSNTVEVMNNNTTIVKYSRPDAGFSIYKDKSGIIQLAVDDEQLIGKSINIFGSDGRLIYSIDITSKVVPLQHLQKDRFYILQSAMGALKIAF